MTEYVVDASVAVKWMIPEEYTEAALRLRGPSAALASPDLVRVEVASVLRKKVRRREITNDQGQTLLSAFRKAPIRLVSTRLLLEGAWEIARRFDRSIYDSLYVALAVAKGCRMVTADRRLLNGLRSSPVSEHLLWVEDLPVRAEDLPDRVEEFRVGRAAAVPKSEVAERSAEESAGIPIDSNVS